MNAILSAAAALQEFCVRKNWRFCFIGGIACQKWSEPRLTDDVDLTLLTGFGDERRYIDELLTWLRPRRPDAAEFAERHRVLLLQTESGVGVDVALAALPFEELATERARDIALTPDLSLRLCTAEDLIVFKTFAARPLDWHDVEMIIVRQGDTALDWKYIREQLAPLLALKEQPGLLDELDALRARLLRNH